MQGVTTAIVAFIFVCLVYPKIVKHRAQYYAALAAILLLIALDAIAHMVGGKASTESGQPVGVGGFAVVCYVFCAILQIAAIILLVLSVGGLSMRELAGEMANAYEVMRRGEDVKEVVIPIKGQMAGAKRSDEDAPRERIVLDLPPQAPPAVAPKKPEGGSLPLES